MQGHPVIPHRHYHYVNTRFSQRRLLVN